jgi:hypothetical protein
MWPPALLSPSRARAERTDVDGGLAGDDLGRQRRELADVEVGQVLDREAVALRETNRGRRKTRESENGAPSKRRHAAMRAGRPACPARISASAHTAHHAARACEPRGAAPAALEAVALPTFFARRVVVPSRTALARLNAPRPPRRRHRRPGRARPPRRRSPSCRQPFSAARVARDGQREKRGGWGAREWRAPKRHGARALRGRRRGARALERVRVQVALVDGRLWCGASGACGSAGGKGFGRRDGWWSPLLFRSHPHAPLPCPPGPAPSSQQRPLEAHRERPPLG